MRKNRPFFAFFHCKIPHLTDDTGMTDDLGPLFFQYFMRMTRVKVALLVVSILPSLASGSRTYLGFLFSCGVLAFLHYFGKIEGMTLT